MKITAKVSLTILTVCILTMSGPASDAQVVTDRNSTLNHIAELYENDMFAAVREEITRMKEASPGVENPTLAAMEAYGVKSVIQMGLPDMDPLVEEFFRTYPHSAKKSSIRYLQGMHYFSEGDYARAYEIFGAVQISRLKESERLEYMYSRAFCAMRVGEHDQALSGFKKILSLPVNGYTSRSSYYLAWLHYTEGGYAEALKLLEPFRDDPEYAPMTGALLLECYFLTGRHRETLSAAEKIFPSLPDSDRRKAARIVSNAAYAISDAGTAKKYLDIYQKDNTDLTMKDHYYSGAVSYSLKMYREALREFSIVSELSDSLGQSAGYQCGNSYLMLKNRLEAMNSFRRAMELDFDAVITEESTFQYAKLSFDLNRDISVFKTYLERYPSSVKADEVYSYIAASYLLNNDYARAVDALGRISVLSAEQGANLQKAAFFRGLQQCSSGSYETALESFALSYRHGRHDRGLALLNQYWNAEALYRTGRYDEAASENLRLLGIQAFRNSSEYVPAMLNLGYDYFNDGKYREALPWFEKYALSPSATLQKRTEASVRAADCHFMLKDYEKAAEAYSEAARSSGSDIYPAYQSAISYGLISRDSRKIEILEDIRTGHQDSGYYLTALYELGRTYTRVQQSEKAAGCFEILACSLPDTSFRQRAFLELGMLASNDGRYDEAVSYFRKVVSANKYSEDAQSALAGMESACQMMNRPEDFLAYLESEGLSSIKTADEKELMLFNTAEQLFLSGEYQAAASRLASFLATWPDGIKTSQALFYLGETYSALGVKEKAASYFKKVMERNDPSFEELATLYYADICYQLERYQEAASSYESLTHLARLGNNRQLALSGMMRSRFAARDYPASLEAADLILSDAASSSGTDDDMKKEALYIKARSLAFNGQREESVPLFEELSADPSTPEGAESVYMLVQYDYDRGDFDGVRNRVYALSDTGTEQNYWLAKCFIVLGDAFAEEEDMEQAEATFRSIEEGYTSTGTGDDVLSQVRSRITKIKNMEEPR